MGAREFRARRLEGVLRITSFRNVDGYSDVLQAFDVVKLWMSFDLQILEFPKADRNPELEFKDATSSNGFLECYPYRPQVVAMGQIYKFCTRYASFVRNFICPETFWRCLHHVGNRIPSPAA